MNRAGDAYREGGMERKERQEVKCDGRDGEEKLQ